MDGIVEALLRLEGAKHKALINADASAYDEHVRTQLRLLDSAADLEGSARKSPEKLASLSRLIQHNTALFLNLVATSPALALAPTGYTSTGNLSTPIGVRFAVEG